MSVYPVNILFLKRKFVVLQVLTNRKTIGALVCPIPCVIVGFLWELWYLGGADTYYLPVGNNFIMMRLSEGGGAQLSHHQCLYPPEWCTEAISCQNTHHTSHIRLSWRGRETLSQLHRGVIRRPDGESQVGTCARTPGTQAHGICNNVWALSLADDPSKVYIPRWMDGWMG